MSKTLVLLHPGVFWVAGAGAANFAAAEKEMLKLLQECDNIVVMDEPLSEHLNPEHADLISRTLHRCMINGMAIRSWAHSQLPNESWAGFPPLSHYRMSDVMEAAEMIVPMICGSKEIILAGGSIVRNGVSTMDKVYDTIDGHHILSMMLHVGVRISDACVSVPDSEITTAP